MSERGTSRGTTVRRVYLIVALFIAVILCILLVVRLQMNISVSVRAYVGGEGIWAKAQKDAVLSLEHYAFYRNEADYQNYLRLIQVPLGDKKARLELQKPVPDMKAVREGFLAGGNHPDDVEPMAWFFRRFHNVSYMSRAIRNWTRGDQLITELHGVAEALHEEIAYGRFRDEKIHSLHARLDVLNRALAKEEDEFSANLSEGTRWANKVSQMLVYFLGFLFAALGVGLSRPIITRIRATEKALFAAQEELHRREKQAMLGLIAEGIGNELRNPLGVMNNAVFFLKCTTPGADETVREYLDIIEKEIGNSQGIISDLLDFCQITAPKAKVFDVHELIEQSIAKCGVPETIRFKAEQPEKPLATNADPQQMEQVLCNLITNAVQAMPDGGALRVCARQVRGARNEERSNKKINLEPRTPNLDPDLDFIEISVVDTGAGIAPEHMDKVFQPLFTTKSRGIGLGLAFCKKLVEANGGRIEVESAPGQGTTFKVMLPAERGEL